jgi:hypothetical protein
VSRRQIFRDNELMEATKQVETLSFALKRLKVELNAALQIQREKKAAVRAALPTKS